MRIGCRLRDYCGAARLALWAEIRCISVSSPPAQLGCLRFASASSPSARFEPIVWSGVRMGAFDGFGADRGLEGRGGYGGGCGIAYASLQRARLRLGSNRLSGRGFEWGRLMGSGPIEVWRLGVGMVPAEGFLTLRFRELAFGSVRTACLVGGSNGAFDG